MYYTPHKILAPVNTSYCHIIHQGRTYQARKIIKKGWFFDLEIPEIYQQINKETF